MSELDNVELPTISECGDNLLSVSIPPMYSGSILADPPMAPIRDEDYEERDILVHQLPSIPEIDANELDQVNDEVTFRERDELYQKIIKEEIVETILRDLTRLEESLSEDPAYFDGLEEGLKFVHTELDDIDKDLNKLKEICVGTNHSLKLEISKLDPEARKRISMSPLNTSVESQDGGEENRSAKFGGSGNSSFGEEDLQKSSTRWSLSVGSPSEDRGSLTDLEDDVESVSHRSESSKENEAGESMVKHIESLSLSNLDTQLPPLEENESLQNRITAWNLKVSDRANAKDA